MFAWVHRCGNRRCVLSCLVVAALFGGAAAVRHFWPVGPGVNPANFRKIALGMSQAEVEKLLGGAAVYNKPIHAPEDARSYQSGYPDWQKPYPEDPPYPIWSLRTWANKCWHIVVIFDAQDRVIARRCVEVQADTPVDKARLWLADQWSKTPQGRIARVEQILSARGLDADDKLSLDELLTYMHDNHHIDFLINPADFGVQDAQELLQQRVGLGESGGKDLRANLKEMLGKVKAAYVVGDGSIRIVAAPTK